MQKTPRIISAFILLLCHFTLAAQDAHEHFELGKRAFASGSYEAAAQHFDAAAREGAGFEAYFNAGNSYQKLGAPGRARLSYERASCLSPRNDRVSEALYEMRSLAGESDLFKRGRYAFAWLSKSEWTWVLTASFWAALLLLVVPPLYTKKSRRYRAVGAAFAVVFAYSCAGMIYWSETGKNAVAINNDVVLRVSPASKAPATSPVAEGKSAKILKRHGGWLFVKTPAGKYGWADAKSLVPVKDAL